MKSSGDTLDKSNAVYPIVNGFSQECLFEGTEKECVQYVKEHRLMDCIIIPV